MSARGATASTCRWIPAGALAAAAAELAQIGDRWAADWGLAGLCTQARILDASFDAAALRRLPWRRLGAGAWRRADDALPAALALAIFGSDAPESALAADVARQASSALLGAIDHWLGRDEVAAPPADPDPQDPRLPGHAGLRFTASIGGARLDGVVTTVWLVQRRFIARPPERTLAAGARQTALAHVPLTLRVELGQAALSLQQLTQLAPGDVIVADLPAGAPAPLVTAAGRTVLRGRVGRQATVRAVLCSTQEVA